MHLGVFQRLQKADLSPYLETGLRTLFLPAALCCNSLMVKVFKGFLSGNVRTSEAKCPGLDSFGVFVPVTTHTKLPAGHCLNSFLVAAFFFLLFFHFLSFPKDKLPLTLIASHSYLQLLGHIFECLSWATVKEGLIPLQRLGRFL